MTDKQTVDASAVPLWWKEIFPAGARKGFYRREGGLTLTFIDRESARLVVTIEAEPGAQGACRGDRMIDPILSARDWSHLIVQFAGSRDAADRVRLTLDALSQDGLFDRVTQIDMLGIGAGATVLLALDGRFAATRKVAICPTAVPSLWPEGAGPVTLMTDGPMGSGPVETALPVGSMLLRLPAGTDPFATLHAAELLDEIIGGGIEGTLHRDSFDGLVADFGPDPTQERPEVKPATDHPDHAWPRERGNVWMLENRDGVLRYLSDRWNGRVIGFEERNGKTLAQTPPVMRGIIAIGDACGLPRPLDERYPWHVFDENLTPDAPDFAARSHGVLLARTLDAAGDALPGVIALDIPQAGSTPADFHPDAPLSRTLEARLEQAVSQAASHGRSLHVDRVSLGLCAGAPSLSPEAVQAVYRDVILRLGRLVPERTGQTSAPVFVLTQAAGSRSDGRAGAILAEAGLEADFPVSKVVIAGPAYPHALMPDMPATADPAERLLMDEREAEAVAALQRGERWFCPSLRLATYSANRITAAFTSLAPLVLDDGPHGFRIDGAADAPRILSAELIDGDRILIECDGPLDGISARLAYAWGWTTPRDGPCTANHGAVRDSWERPSMVRPGRTLHRNALAGVVPIWPADRVGAA